MCLDTNVLVAAFASRGLCADLLRLIMTEHQLVLPEVVAEELRTTLSQKPRLSSEALATVEAVLDRLPAASGDQAPSPLRLRNPDDERVLAAALAGGAQILVSGDKDFLVVAGEAPIPIMSPREFMTLISERTS